jgi:hypothetical protein
MCAQHLMQAQRVACGSRYSTSVFQRHDSRYSFGIGDLFRVSVSLETNVHFLHSAALQLEKQRTSSVRLVASGPQDRESTSVFA